MTRALLLTILSIGYSLTLIAQPFAAFTADRTTGCSPLVVHFSNETTGASAAATYHWDLGNGNTVVATNPQAIYTAPGSYTVTLTVQDGGRSSTTTGTVTVDQPPTVNFTTGVTKVCSPNPIDFTSTAVAGSSPLSSYLWDFGDGGTETVYSAAAGHVYTATGTYVTSLTVIDADGCSSTKALSNSVTVLPRLTAAFTTGQQVLCTVTAPETFTNTSTGPGTLSYQWGFGDGGSSTAANPTYSYSTAGTYTVTLTVTSSEGCVTTDVQPNLLDVANYSTNFSEPPAICQGGEATFNDESTPAPTSRTWTVDGVTQSNFQDLFYYGIAGTHTITLSNIYGTCPQAVTKSFTVNPLPVPVPFTSAIQGKCGAPVTVDFTDHTPGVTTWNWNFNYYGYPSSTATGGPTNSTVYNANGGYEVELTVGNTWGCYASELELVTITAPSYSIYETDNQPEASCGGSLTKSFAITSTAGLASYTWGFGDGGTSTALAPTHTYSVVGQYGALLNWTDVNGCKGVSNIIPTIISPPLNYSFSATPTTVCVGQMVTFSDQGTGNPTFTEWSFGDGGGNGSAGTATYSYYAPGVYPVTLNVSNAACTQTVTKSSYITVLGSPTVNIAPTYNCLGNRAVVNFTVNATNATQLSWNFGDGATATTAGTITTMTHTYSANGAYSVFVTASNSNCSSSTNASVYILMHQRPKLSASSATVCPDGTLAVQLVIANNPAISGIFEYSVHFEYGDSTNYLGDVGYGNQSGNTLNYSLDDFQVGESGLRVITTSDYIGCADTSNIIPLAIASVTAGYTITEDDRCYQLPVVLQGVAQLGGGDKITSWAWSFGDGTGSTQAGMTSHVYASPGVYTVTLTVTDAAGCGSGNPTGVAYGGSGSQSQEVTVDGPEAGFYSGGGNTLPLGSVANFINTSNVYGAVGVVSYSWNFGDGGTSTQAGSVAHVYTSPGTYLVTLTAQDGTGSCVSTATLTMVIQPFNNAFRMNDSYVSSGGCPPMTVQFTNTSVNYVSVLWNFGDGETSTVVSPSHVYAQPGTFYVTLTAVNGAGQTLVTEDSVIVKEPSAVLTETRTALCVGQADTLSATVDKEVKGYAFDFGDGVVGTTGADATGGGASGAADSTIVHVYTVPGTYTARLVVTDTVGCAAAAAATVAVEVHAPPIAWVTPPSATICLNGQVTLVASGGATYSWTPATGLSAVDVAQPVATPAVSTLYTVTVADDIGCTGSESIMVGVVQRTTVSVTPDSSALCPGKSVVLQASGAERYTWIGSTGGLSATDIAAPVARPVDSMRVEVVGSDTLGCFADTVAVVVDLLPQPTVSAGPDVTVQAALSVTLMGESTGDVATWLWTPASYLSCTDCAQPVCTPLEPRTYIATVTGPDGCAASDTVVVSLLCDESKLRIPDAFTPNGDGHNDRWNILGISQVNHLVIFDRWGEKVFERDHFYPADVDAGWDGTANGRPAPAGVYVYFVEMQCPTGGAFERKGTVVLIR